MCSNSHSHLKYKKYLCFFLFQRILKKIMNSCQLALNNFYEINSLNFLYSTLILHIMQLIYLAHYNTCGTDLYFQWIMQNMPLLFLWDFKITCKTWRHCEIYVTLEIRSQKYFRIDWLSCHLSSKRQWWPSHLPCVLPSRGKERYIIIKMTEAEIVEIIQTMLCSIS